MKQNLLTVHEEMLNSWMLLQIIHQFDYVSTICKAKHQKSYFVEYKLVFIKDQSNVQIRKWKMNRENKLVTNESNVRD